MRLRTLLTLALVHGLIYVFAVPPWQHYDEPGHFEYVWRLAMEPDMPQPDSTNDVLRAEMVRSMLRHGFYREGIPLPDLNQHPIAIGYTQTPSPPMYYWLAGLPIRVVNLLGITDVTTQLYASRLMSLLVFVVTVAIVAAAAADLFGPGHPVRWALPLMFALLPSNADLMTAVNDDVIAILLSTLFLWIAIRIIRRGLSWDRLALLIIIALTGVAARRAIGPVMVTLPVVIALAWAHGRPWATGLVWGGVVAFGLMALAFTLRHDGAQSWITEGVAECSEIGCPPELGAHALKLAFSPDPMRPPYLLWQLLDSQQRRKMAGHTITFGAWMWTDPATPANNTSAFVAVAGSGGYAESQSVALDPSPTFHAITLTLPTDLSNAYVQLYARPGPMSHTQYVYFDGMLMISGTHLFDRAPHYSDAMLITGTWNSQSFVNLLRNPSVEDTAWRVDSQADRLTQPLIRDTILSHIVYAAQDPQGQVYYRYAAIHWLQTFWARFGWGNIPLATLWVYDLLWVVTLLGGLGALLTAIRAPQRVDWAIVLGLGLPLVLLSFAAFTRGVSSLFVGFWLPGWRYAAPVNLAVLLLLVLGWLSVVRLYKLYKPSQSLRPTRFDQKFMILFALIPLLCLDAYALYSQVVYYAQA